MSKLEEARIALEVAACEYAETGRAKPGTAKMLQAARDFAAAEAEVHGDYIASLTRQSAEAYAFRRVAEWLRAGGLTKEVGGD